ncbi:hypothetical protein TNCV_3540751 [Trichonephila clavipes]|nr:hypothetical protein TNCV_3540751 [Trichonephila clavipes]
MVLNGMFREYRSPAGSHHLRFVSRGSMMNWYSNEKQVDMLKMCEDTDFVDLTVRISVAARRIRGIPGIFQKKILILMVRVAGKFIEKKGICGMDGSASSPDFNPIK